MISVTLPDDLEAWANVEVAHGHADSVQSVLVEALRLRRLELERLRALLDEGRSSEALDGDRVLDELDAWIAEDRAAAVA